MTPEEALAAGFQVKLENPSKPGISLGLEGLEEFIRQEISKAQPDYKALTEAVRSIAVANNEELIEAVKSISLTQVESGDMQVMAEAFKALGELNIEAPNVEVTVEAPDVPKRLIVSADVEHEMDRHGVAILKKINFNYGEEM